MFRCLLATALFLAASLSLAAQPFEKADPIVGKWVWYGDAIVVFNADGTGTNSGGLKGTWQYLHNSEVQRKYRLVWNDGVFIDKATMSEDQKTMFVQNDKGDKYTVRRAAVTP